MNLINFIRLILTLIVSYIFFVEYLGKKYYKVFNNNIQSQLNKNDVRDIFNMSQIDFNNNNFQQRQSSQWSQIGKFISQKQNKHQLFDFKIKKKVNNYVFTFYNMHIIQIKLTDLGYDSYLEFRLIDQNKQQISITQKIPFKIPESISSQEQNLNFQFSSKQFSINVSQFITLAVQNNQFNDGFINEQLFYLSENKSKITSQDYKKFGSAKTITFFNISLKRADLQLQANLVHVIRLNQCYFNKFQHVIKQKCMGGYGEGKINIKIFMKNNVDKQNNKIHGDWFKQTLNLDNSRARTIFIGYQSNQNYLKNLIPSININQYSIEWPIFNHRSVEIDFIGFNKKQYYAKNDRIQKQRWLGMTLYKTFNQNGQTMNNSPLQNYFFINGNIHPIHQIDFQLSSQQSIHFTKKNNKQNTNKTLTPNFDIKFDIFNVNFIKQNNFLDNKQIYRLYGSFSGWIDETSLFQNKEQKAYYDSTEQYKYVQFYNITGLIQISQQIY